MDAITSLSAAAPVDDERERILNALAAWVRQRPGFHAANYGASSYRAERRRVARQKRDAEALLRAVRWHPDIGAAELRAALRDAYSGRLSWDGARLDYCVGGYWCTEYRAAACAVLASALWRAARRNLSDDARRANAGDTLRRKFRAEFGRSLALRWFD